MAPEFNVKPNPQVLTVPFADTFHRFLGAPLCDMVKTDVKPALYAAIEGECVKCPKDPNLQPTRFSRAETAKRAGGASGKGDGGKGDLMMQCHALAGCSARCLAI